MFFSIIFLLLPVSSGEHVQVDPEVQAFPGQSVLLPCRFLGSSKATQVLWIYKADGGDRVNIAIFHPTFGHSFPNSPLKGRVRFTQDDVLEGSIEISDVRMSDEGLYTCGFATYPSGNPQGTTKLVIRAPPTSQPPTSQPPTVTGTTSALGTSAVSIAPCMQIETEIQAFPMGSVRLRCKVLEPAKVKVTQVSWIYEADGGGRVNIAVFHPTFGQSFPDSPLKGRVRFTQDDLDESSIEISGVRMSDEGGYICQYSTFPSGALESTTRLVMRAPPTPCI